MHLYNTLTNSACRITTFWLNLKWIFERGKFEIRDKNWLIMFFRTVKKFEKDE